MTADAYADRLAAVAVELVQRVRDDDPQDNGRWLAGELPDPADQFALCFVLAAAVPDERPWAHLTAWARLPRGGRTLGPNELAPCGTRAAYRRHLAHGEDPCDDCKDGNRVEERERGRARRAVDNAVDESEAA